MRSKRYFKTHEWIEEIDPDTFYMGISKYACDQLGNIVFIEEKPAGELYDEGESLAILESVKAVGDIYAPFTAKLLDTNEDLLEEPESLTEDTWVVKIHTVDGIKLDEIDALDASEYAEFLNEL